MNDELNFEELFADEANTHDVKNVFDKEKWLLEKIKEKEEAYDLIDTVIEMLDSDGNALKDYLNLLARLPKYSAANLLLIFGQNQGVNDLRTFEDWKFAGFSVTKGEKGIVILSKTNEYIKESDGSTGYNYGTKNVFDISQTNAEISIPKFSNQTEIIRALIKSSPVPIIPSENSDIKCFFDPEKNIIFLSKMTDPNEIFNCLCNEIAHARLQYKNDEYLRSSYNAPAHCISYVLAKRYGFEDTLPSDGLDIFSSCDTLGEKREILNEIARVANVITSGIDKTKEELCKTNKDER